MLAFGFRHIEDLAEKIQVFPDGQVAVQAETLRQVAQFLVGFFHLSGEFVAGDADLTAGGLERADHQADGRRLSGSIRPDQADHFACPHLQVQPVHGAQSAKRLDQVFGFKQDLWFHGHFARKVTSAGMPGFSLRSYRSA